MVMIVELPVLWTFRKAMFVLGLHTLSEGDNFKGSCSSKLLVKFEKLTFRIGSPETFRVCFEFKSCLLCAITVMFCFEDLLLVPLTFIVGPIFPYPDEINSSRFTKTRHTTIVSQMEEHKILKQKQTCVKFVNKIN